MSIDNPSARPNSVTLSGGYDDVTAVQSLTYIVGFSLPVQSMAIWPFRRRGRHIGKAHGKENADGRSQAHRDQR
jgi:outer membrane biogenesis lipoprotein LolB